MRENLLHNDRPQSPELSVVMPCYNEADLIEGVVREWVDQLRQEVPGAFEIIVVNDGSMDGTGRVLDRLRRELPCLRVLHQLNVGHDIAIRRAYELARGRYVLQVDTNGCCDPADFLSLWIHRHEHPLVLGYRIHRQDGLLHRLGTELLTRIISLLFRYPIKDPNVPFRLLHKQTALNYLRAFPPAIRSVNLALTVSMKRDYPQLVAEVPIPHRMRKFPRGKRRGQRPSLPVRACRYSLELLSLRFRLTDTGMAPSAKPALSEARN